ASSAPICRRSFRANSGRGASGTSGSRSASKGSVITAPFGVARTERAPRPCQQGFGGGHRAAEVLGDLGDRKAVEIAQCQCRAVVRAELVEHFPGAHALEALVLAGLVLHG